MRNAKGKGNQAPAYNRHRETTPMAVLLSDGREHARRQGEREKENLGTTKPGHERKKKRKKEDDTIRFLRVRAGGNGGVEARGAAEVAVHGVRRRTADRGPSSTRERQLESFPLPARDCHLPPVKRPP